jgi:hypothetical protein
MMNKKYTFLGALIILIPILVVYSYDFLPLSIRIGDIELLKLSAVGQDNSEKLNEIEQTIKEKRIKADGFKRQVKNVVVTDTIQIKDTTKTFVLPDLPRYADKEDSSHQRIMLIGDSQAGGICYALNDYCSANGHRLESVFVWNSATILNFAYSTRIEEAIAKYKPTFIFVVMGLNELYAKDIAKRSKAAKLFHEKIKHIPYLWIGPANFKEDKGINKVFEETAEAGRYYLSKDLQLPRSTDNRHPSSKGYRIWMEYISSFMQGSTLFPFNFNSPTKNYRIRARIISLNAAKDRGY